MWFKKIFNNFTCCIINRDFYVIAYWMHYTLFISILRSHKANCYCQLNFPCVRFFEINYWIFPVRVNFIKVFFDWKCFICLTITFILNIVFAIKTSHYYWFKIIFFFWFKKVFKISKYFIFSCFACLYSFNYVVINYLCLKRSFTFLTVLSSIFILKRFKFLCLGKETRGLGEGIRDLGKGIGFSDLYVSVTKFSNCCLDIFL